MGDELMTTPPRRTSSGARWGDVKAAEWRGVAAGTRQVGASDAVRVTLLGHAAGTWRAGDVAERWSAEPAARLAVVPAGRTLAWSWGDGCSATDVLLPTSFVTKVATAAGLSKMPTLPAVSPRVDRVGVRLVRSLRDELRGDGVGTRLYVENVAGSLALHLLRQVVTRRAEPVAGGLDEDERDAAERFLREHLEEAIGVEDLAEAVGCSAGHLARRFTLSFGEPPHRHLLRLRVERARALLENSPHLSIAAVAARSGFCDQSHLARHCRRLLGVGPAELRAG